jgi:hypothetical protein
VTVGAVAIIVCVASAQPAAQTSPPTTRAEALRQQRADKQQHLIPNVPDRIQRGITAAEERALLFGRREGLQPTVGMIARGSGIAFGGLFRDRDILKRYGTFETVALFSLRRYWLLEARTLFPDLAGGRIAAQASASLREHPRDDFYGIGPGSSRENRTSFLQRTTDLAGSAGIRLAQPLLVGGGLRYFQPRIGRGRADERPSIEARFSGDEAPGLDVRSNFVTSSTFVELDYREPRNARKGGFYRVDLTRFNDTTGGMDFTRTDVDLRQYLGFLAGRRVIVLRGLLSMTDADSGGKVPFYLMPFLGSSRTLRGAPSYRFRGPHAMLLQAEYRWEIWSGFEGALFYDAGKVALHRSDLNLDNLESDYGIGFRFNTNNGIIFRVDTAVGGREGTKVRISFGPFL